MRLLAALGISLALGTSALSQEQPRVPTTAIEAQRILSALYPECRTQAVSVEAIQTGRTIQLRVGEPNPDRRLLVRQRMARLLLSADVEFDSQHVLTSFRAAGSILRDSENTRLRSRMRAATQPDVVLAEERLSFRIATSQAAQEEAPIADLEHVLGTLSIGSATLKPVSADPGSQYGAIWEFSVMSRKPGQSLRDYAIQLEPYGGRVVGLKLQ